MTYKYSHDNTQKSLYRISLSLSLPVCLINLPEYFCPSSFCLFACLFHQSSRLFLSVFCLSVSSIFPTVFVRLLSVFLPVCFLNLPGCFSSACLSHQSSRLFLLVFCLSLSSRLFLSVVFLFLCLSVSSVFPVVFVGRLSVRLSSRGDGKRLT